MVKISFSDPDPFHFSITDSFHGTNPDSIKSTNILILQQGLLNFKVDVQTVPDYSKKIKLSLKSGDQVEQHDGGHF